MIAPNKMSDILFWSFPMLIIPLALASLWLWYRESEALGVLAKKYAGLHTELGSPSSRVLWTGLASLRLSKRLAFRAAASNDPETLRIIDSYEYAIRIRRALLLVLVVCWFGLMLTGDLTY